MIARIAIRPHDHPAAIARVHRIRPQHRIRPHKAALRGRQRAAALILAPHKHRAATRRARRIKQRIPAHRHLLAGHSNRAAPFACRKPRRIERPGHIHRARIAPVKHDRAIFHTDRARLHHTIKIDHPVNRRRPGFRTDQHLAPIRQHRPLLADQRIRGNRLHHRVIHTDMDQIVAIKIEREPLPRPQRHTAKPRRDHAAILDPRRDKRHKTPLGRGYLTLIDDPCPDITGDHKVITAIEKILIVDIDRGRDQRADIDLRMRPDMNARRVDQGQLPAGRQAAQDRARPAAANHPVEQGGRRRGLKHLDPFPRRDIETLPVDDRRQRRLVNRQKLTAMFGDRCRTRRDNAILRQGMRRTRKHRKPKRQSR